MLGLSKVDFAFEVTRMLLADLVQVDRQNWETRAYGGHALFNQLDSYLTVFPDDHEVRGLTNVLLETTGHSELSKVAEAIGFPGIAFDLRPVEQRQAAEGQ